MANDYLVQGQSNIGSAFPYFIDRLSVNLGEQPGKVGYSTLPGTGAGNTSTTVGNNWNGELSIGWPAKLAGIPINGDFQEIEARGLLTISSSYTGIVELCLLYAPQSDLQLGTTNPTTFKCLNNFTLNAVASQTNFIIWYLQNNLPGQFGFAKGGMIIPAFYNKTGSGVVNGNLVLSFFGK